jgi:hypothetical protein
MQPGEGREGPAEIGAVLAAARAERGLSIEDVSETTRIRGTLIRRMEDGDFDGCGGAVYARGHIRSIARTVGLDSEPLVEMYNEVAGAPDHRLATGPLEIDPIARHELRGRSGGRWMPLMIGALVVVCIVALLGVVLPGGNGKKNPATLPSPTGAVTTHPPSAAPRTTAPVAFSGVNVQVRIKNNPSWLFVRDGSQRVLLQQLLQPGEVRDFKAAQQLRVVVGNAGAVDLRCNGRSLGSPGGAGQVSTIVFTLDASGDCAAG